MVGIADGLGRKSRRRQAMPTCQKCGDEVEEVVKVKVGRKALRVCESCADELREQEEVSEEAEGVIRGMMEYKGRG
jgi:ribosome-binding protein aMBF1 (putative translation factor)